MKVKQPGFSTIELIVVVAIMAIMALSVSFSMFSFADSMEKEQAESYLYNLASVTQIISRDYGDQTSTVKSILPATRELAVPLSALSVSFGDKTYLEAIDEYFNGDATDARYRKHAVRIYYDPDRDAPYAFFGAEEDEDEEILEVRLF